MNDRALNKWAAVIGGYRTLISERYQYDYLQSNYDIPDSFDKKRIELFRDFFLDYIYPPIEKRRELNAAFESLDRHIKNPKNLLTILVDSSSILFKFGRHLPKILNAAISALKSFRKANKFEEKLRDKAILDNVAIPLSQEDLKTLVASLPKDDVLSFINEAKSLFEIIKNKKLVGRIIELLTLLIDKMNKRSGIYSDSEMEAFNIGLNIIEGSNDLFNQLSPTEANALFDIGIQIELQELDKIYKLWSLPING